MKEKIINILKPYLLQKEIEEDSHRFRIVACGRRWGKTLMAMRELFNMLVRGYMKTGRKQRGWIVAPTFSLVREDWITAEILLKDAVISKNQTEMKMDFGDIGFLEFKSAERGSDGLIGAGLDACVLDEVKLITKESWEYGLRPSLADKKGRALFISTPKGRGWFYNLWLKGQEKDNSEIKSWKYWSNTNPFFPQDEWELLKATTPEMIFRQEYQADFLEDEAAVFHNITDCIYGKSENPMDNEYYSIGLDLGRTEDFTVLTALRNSTKQVTDIMRFNKIDWSLQKEQIKVFCRKYRKYILYIDSTGLGDPIEDDLRKAGINTMNYKFSNSSKEKLIETLVIAIEQKLIKIPNEDKYSFLIDELKSFTYEILPSKNIRYTAPEGLHDDGVISLGLAVMGVSHLLYNKPKEQQIQKKWGTADDWENFYRLNDNLHNQYPYAEKDEINTLLKIRRYKRIFQRV